MAYLGCDQWFHLEPTSTESSRHAGVDDRKMNEQKFKNFGRNCDLGAVPSNIALIWYHSWWKRQKLWWWWCRAQHRFAISHLSIFYLDTGHSMKLYWAESTHTLVYHTSWRASKWSMVLFNTDPRNPLAGGSSSIPLPSTSFCSDHWLLAWADHKSGPSEHRQTDHQMT